jgi:hypothetical protein
MRILRACEGKTAPGEIVEGALMGALHEALWGKRSSESSQFSTSGVSATVVHPSSDAAVAELTFT